MPTGDPFCSLHGIHVPCWQCVQKELDEVPVRTFVDANVAALTEDLAKYRALVEKMRPVYEAVMKWREAQRQPWNSGWLLGFLEDESMRDDEDDDLANYPTKKEPTP